ncbi:hypothetical protein LOZ80_26015 [Paenibacillus sp. HWE-109]|uniref:hypothetical protein n=1 Tax=Paenibacillus sp. HWE-109 TaxID=1306526 RepID=UPI001EDFBDC8|nr:hypothetical protein [Paenibacillus sp. HWE-109]UKS25037.1 hypothetical protein LOZ80_26015 [Paenibacillus sp. HWE-109]
MNLRDQLTSVQNQLAEEKSKAVDKNLELISSLEKQEEKLLHDIMIEEDNLKSAQIQQQNATIDASNIAIPRQYDFNVDYNDIYGTQILNDRIQGHLDDLREQLHNYYMGLQEERDCQIRELRKDVDDATEQNKELIKAKGQAEIERNDFAKRFENAGELIKELQAEVARLKEREMELIETANKAPLLYPHKVIDIGASNLDAGDAIREERAKELALKPKVWNLEWVDELKKTEYKGVGEDGTELIIKRLELGRYNVQVGPRPEQVVTEVVVADSQDSVTPEETFPTVPSAEAPIISGEIPLVVPTPESSGQGQTVEERLSALEAHVFGYVKGKVA